jgi:hypothetical protein
MRVDTLQPGGGEQAGFGPLPAVTDHLSEAEPRKPRKNPLKKCPRNLRGSCQPPGNGLDPVHLMLGVDEWRMPKLIPLRQRHVVQSPLTRSADPSGISGYLGKNDFFDGAIASFTFACSDQTEAEHAARKRAIPNAALEGRYRRVGMYRSVGGCAGYMLA